MGLLRRLWDIAVVARPLLKDLLDSLEDGRFDYAVPRTAVAGATERLGKAVGQVQGDLASIEPLMGSLAIRFFKWMSRPTTIERIRRGMREEGMFVHQAAQAAADFVDPGPAEDLSPEDAVRFKNACVYLDELHRRLPYAPLALISKMPIWTPEFFWDVLRLVHYRQQVRKTTGEAKGYALQALARHLTENIHQRYLQTLAFAELLTSSQMQPKKMPSYGGLVRRLRETSLVRELVLEDASMVRNAASHVERWRLDAEAERITIEDGMGVLKTRCYTFGELETLCDILLADISAFGTALIQHIGDRLAEIVLNTQMPELVLGTLAGHAVDPEMAERERQRMSALFAPLRTRWATLFPEQQGALPAKSTAQP